MLTQISIRFIDISDMIKNKTFRPVWSLVMNFTKIILLVAITLSITSLSIQLDNYNEKIIEKLNKNNPKEEVEKSFFGFIFY